MTPPSLQQWHWAEGNKYALEAMKALLLLNGGGAVALLTFIGNRAPSSAAARTVMAEAVGNALLSFGGGTVSTVIVFIFAYLTQLHYGNSSVAAPWWHRLTYLFVITAVAGFVIGIWFSRTAVVASF